MFKLGDIVTGRKNVGYAVTNSDSVCKIVGIYEKESMRVKVLEHKSNKSAIGLVYVVAQKAFIPYKLKNNNLIWK